MHLSFVRERRNKTDQLINIGAGTAPYAIYKQIIFVLDIW